MWHEILGANCVLLFLLFFIFFLFYCLFRSVGAHRKTAVKKKRYPRFSSAALNRLHAWNTEAIFNKRKAFSRRIIDKTNNFVICTEFIYYVQQWHFLLVRERTSINLSCFIVDIAILVFLLKPIKARKILLLLFLLLLLMFCFYLQETRSGMKKNSTQATFSNWIKSSCCAENM